MEEDIDIFVRRVTMELMITLYRNGIKEVHVGGMMRMVGVGEECAATHDHERITIDEDFAKYIETVMTMWEDDIQDGEHTIH